MVFAVLVRQLVVEWIAASNLGALLFELSFGGIDWGHGLIVFFKGVERVGRSIIVTVPRLVRISCEVSLACLPMLEPSLSQLYVVGKMDAGGACRCSNKRTEICVVSRCAPRVLCKSV
jgi:hypothetical protein